jgi:hypothetical protein
VPAVVEQNCSRHLVEDGVEGFAVRQDIDDPNDREMYEACMQRYLDATRRLCAEPGLRAKCAANALRKAESYSNRMVQQRMIDNYYYAYETQVTGKGGGSSANKQDSHSGVIVKSTASEARAAVAVSTGARLSEFQSSSVHWFFSSLARVIIFLLWILLGMPAVTETRLEATNIRQSSYHGESSEIGV